MAGKLPRGLRQSTSLSGGVFGDVAAFCGPLDTQGPQNVARDLVSFWVSTLDTSCVQKDVFTPALPLQGHGLLHPHILVILLGHDLGSHVGLASRRAGDSGGAGARSRPHSARSSTFAMGAAPEALPLLESQRLQAGQRCRLAQPVEPDGHEVLAEERALQGQDGALTLTGCYASLRPKCQRRSEASNFPALGSKRAFCSDYKRLVIHNRFHKCTQACFERTLASADSQFFSPSVFSEL